MMATEACGYTAALRYGLPTPFGVHFIANYILMSFLAYRF
jgi:hypothetical protein